MRPRKRQNRPRKSVNPYNGKILKTFKELTDQQLEKADGFAQVFSEHQFHMMKSIVPMSVITVLTALALVGCNQNSPSNSTEKLSPNSSMDHTNGMMGGSTNMPTSTNNTGAANDATR